MRRVHTRMKPHGVLLFFFFFNVTADSGKRKKKGNELEQIDCTPPEHILPGSKERPLVPLQPQNKDWKVRSHTILISTNANF